MVNSTAVRNLTTANRQPHEDEEGQGRMAAERCLGKQSKNLKFSRGQIIFKLEYVVVK